MQNDMQNDTPKGGYYRVNILAGGRHLPYLVFAHSDYEAAHIVREETGYFALQADVEGPFPKPSLGGGEHPVGGAT